MRIPCLKCGCTRENIINIDCINHIVCEYEAVCENCGNSLRFWAYGYSQDPETIGELLRWKPYPISQRIGILFRATYWIIRNTLNKLLRIV